MNRFRTKKKAKDDSNVSDQSSMPSLKGLLRGKKVQEEEPKKQIDLENALPNHDEFRTSLLMTGLSARFSMLREQDDPTTKIGKASDDSVLFPKRQSRMMMEYGLVGGGLTDIAEVESIKAPFARMDLHASADDVDSLKGSIMDRGKPTDGNNLFGGRQKILVGGRTLYEGDVASSSYQKWKKEEKERRLLSGEDDKEEIYDAAPETLPRPSEEYSFATRSESPMLAGYNRRRETSSTTSSSLARNSTAATSVASQQAASVKDWQSQPTAPTSAHSTPAVERSVTRTRRLYEQSLNQDMQEHQSSALSRIDTLTGRRAFGTRTPDLSNNASSPTFGFGDRRPILSKASAPNLRSVSPPASASPAGTPDLGVKVCNLAETRINFVGTPPLSPPISETSDLGGLAIQPNDRGKATAMGVFQKPAQQYDESKYAERQLRLRQGRETPVQPARTESNATGRSRSSSSTKRQQLAPKTDLSIQTAPKETIYSPVTFLDDSDASPLPKELQSQEPQNQSPTIPATSQPTVQRPSDKDHPAFRPSAIPTPLSFSTKASSDPSPVSEEAAASSATSHPESPLDSPTLGPGTGLSGMVRRHMRSESNTSSIYGGLQSSGLDTKFPNPRESMVLGVMGAKGNGWQDQQWNPYQDDANNRDPAMPSEKSPEADRRAESEAPSTRTSHDGEKEEDEFASQLASARRRVQQRLTSYVESDSSRSNSPLPLAEPPREAGAHARPNALGLLRGKSSRGSLVERNRDVSQPKAMKLLGIGAATMTTSPSPAQQSFEDIGLPPMKEEEPVPLEESREYEAENDREADAQSSNSQEGEEENVHPGLRAFRQARRELQKRKELDSLARHPGQPQPPTGNTQEPAPVEASPTPERDNGRTRRAPSRDRKPPPVFYQQRAPSEESYRSGTNSRAPSRPGSRNDRDRSGSDTSNGRSRSRPRLPPNQPTYDDPRQVPGGPKGPQPFVLRPPTMRSPGLPGTDVRRSPMMPPQPPYSNGVPSPRRFDRSESVGALAVQTNRGLEPISPGQFSPLSPGSAGLPPSPRPLGNGSPAPPAPSNLGPRRPSAPPVPSPGAISAPAYSTTKSTLNESMKKVINKKDISDPTFVMSTSRVPTVSLPHSTSSPDARQPLGPRSRSDSAAWAGSNASPAAYAAPPLPPINPRRKQDGRSVMGPGSLMNHSEGGVNSAPHLPLSNSAGSSLGSAPSSPYSGRDEHRGPFSAASDDDDARHARWRLRKHQNHDAPPSNNGPPPRAPSAGGHYPSMRDARSAFVNAGPPVSRSVVMRPPGAPMGLPGGMI